jgi:hypothetical protein
MSGNIPNILIILLAVVTYGSLAYVVMRFALRDTRPYGGGIASTRRPRSISMPGVEPVKSVLAALQRESGLDPSRHTPVPIPTPVPRAPPPQRSP